MNLDLQGDGGGIRRRPLPGMAIGPPPAPLSPGDDPMILDRTDPNGGTVLDRTTPEPAPGLPPGSVKGPTEAGSPEGPRDRPGGGMTLPPMLNQPGQVSQAPSRPTPSMPSSPSPVSAQPPRPFTPLDPTLSSSQTAMPTIKRPGAPMAGGGLLGHAGGLLGGGLGVAGNTGGQDPQSLADAIYQILLMKHGGSGGGY